MAWLDGWSKRLEYTIDHERVSEDLTDFPVLMVVASGAGRNSFDATDVFDELTAQATIFQDDFSNGGTNWYNVAGTADYSGGYLKHNADGERARTINLISLGREWDMTFKFINKNRGSYADQIKVNPVYTSAGGVDIEIYLRQYSSSSYQLTFSVEGSSRGSVGTYNWYNTYTSWKSARIKRSGQSIYFKVWIPPDPEPINWNITTSCTDDFPIAAQFDFLTTYTDSSGSGLDDIVVSGTVSNNTKIAVTDSTGLNQLPVEIEYWDANLEVAYLWAKVPTVTSGTDTKLYLYYDSTKLDNDLYVGSTGSAPARSVWDDNYISVWHFNSALNSLEDATSNFHHGTAHNMESSDFQDGTVWDFDGSNEYVNIPYNADHALTVALTYEAFYYLDSWVADSRILSKTQSGGYQLGINDPGSYPGELGAIIYAGGSYRSVSISHAGLDKYAWHYTAASFDGQYLKLVVDDSVVDTYDHGSTTTISYSTNNDLIIAAEAGSASTPDGQYTNGKINEVRISNIKRSDAWLKATNYTIFDNFMLVAESPAPVFTASGTVTVDGYYISGIPVRLYRRSTGQFVAETTTVSGGLFEIDTPYYESHYIIAMYTTSGTNAIIYDWIAP